MHKLLRFRTNMTFWIGLKLLLEVIPPALAHDSIFSPRPGEFSLPGDGAGLVSGTVSLIAPTAVLGWSVPKRTQLIIGYRAVRAPTTSSGKAIGR